MQPIKTHEMLAGGFARPSPKPYKTEIPTYDDEDEWEYEYSTTETETYYLTLDLSIPEFTTRDTRNIVQAGRGGYLSSWIGDPEKSNGNSSENKARYRFAADDIDEEDDQELPEREDQDPDDIDTSSIDPALKAVDATAASTNAATGDPTTGPADASSHSQTGGSNAINTASFEAPRRSDPDADAGEVQILELHSKTPIIAYRGRIFEGQWAENSGTEMIFAAQGGAECDDTDGSESLPRIDTLPGGIDLLAASSARILTTERKIQPRLDTNLDEVKSQLGIRVVAGRDLNGDRRKQAAFLENLMAVKRIKGEADSVPVFARPPINKSFRDDRDPDWKPRRRKLGPVKAIPRMGRTVVMGGAVGDSKATGEDKDKGKAVEPQVGEDITGQEAGAEGITEMEAEAQAAEPAQSVVFQPPWQPRSISGPVPFFSTPQFRPRRKKQQLPNVDEPKKQPLSKTSLPVSRSARTALLSEDHGVSVSGVVALGTGAGTGTETKQTIGLASGSKDSETAKEDEGGDREAEQNSDVDQDMTGA
ncbi:hypothetical protein CFIMG_006107RA [Ceratocystis fimbriata CBS 114723]|uniref:Transcription factor TFIIIC triple barrel domain-containing protein n=1 Tax=Ceratocystis fimbriata CBS 114723 TaxID=1035309 RepID=A0A2C5X202_9PEZI|nr:hypothetical protein CFIMG_006107RA [Ceratocystis fimbriata CBS 114723]